MKLLVKGKVPNYKYTKKVQSSKNYNLKIPSCTTPNIYNISHKHLKSK